MANFTGLFHQVETSYFGRVKKYLGKNKCLQYLGLFSYLWLLGWQTAFLPQMTGPSQTLRHSLCPKLERAVVQDSAPEQSPFERHFSAKAQTPPRHS